MMEIDETKLKIFLLEIDRFLLKSDSKIQFLQKDLI